MKIVAIFATQASREWWPHTFEPFCVGILADKIKLAALSGMNVNKGSINWKTIRIKMHVSLC